MSAAQYPLLIEQHAAFDKLLRYLDSAREPVPMAGYTADMDIRLSTGELVVKLSTENGGIVLHPEDGSIRLKITAAATGSMKFTKALYDLRLKPPALEPFRLLEGPVTLSRGQTR
jgi:hypothetical protein